MLRWFPRLQVATACFSCSPPDLKLLDPYFIFMYMHNNHCHQATAHLQLIIIIIISSSSFMQGIYTYIPETNYVPRKYSVAAILLLLFMVFISLVSMLDLLYFYISTFQSTCAVSNMAVFCSSLTSCFPGMLLTYFLNDFEIVPVTPIFTGITFVFTFHMRCISIVRSSHFIIFSAYYYYYYGGATWYLHSCLYRLQASSLSTASKYHRVMAYLKTKQIIARRKADM